MNSSRMRRLSLTGSIAGPIAASIVLLGAAPAFSHVSVQPGTAAKGGYSTVSFKVPNERDNAATVRLEVTFPADHPLSSVSTQAVPGWEVEVTKSKLEKPLEVHGKKIDEAVTKVTWTGGTIEPGQFQQFPVSLGQLPEDVGQLVFKAIQTYDNDEVVRWIEEKKEGAEEPDHPAPVLGLTAAAGATDAKAASTAEEDGSAETAASTDSTARVLGAAGIAVGVLGVAFGLLAGRRRPSPSA